MNIAPSMLQCRGLLLPTGNSNAIESLKSLPGEMQAATIQLSYDLLFSAYVMCSECVCEILNPFRPASAPPE